MQDRLQLVLHERHRDERLLVGQQHDAATSSFAVHDEGLEVVRLLALEHDAGIGLVVLREQRGEERDAGDRASDTRLPRAGALRQLRDLLLDAAERVPDASARSRTIWPASVRDTRRRSRTSSGVPSSSSSAFTILLMAGWVTCSVWLARVKPPSRATSTKYRSACTSTAHRCTRVCQSVIVGMSIMHFLHACLFARFRRGLTGRTSEAGRRR